MGSPDGCQVADKEGIFALSLALLEVNVGKLFGHDGVNGFGVDDMGKGWRCKRSGALAARCDLSIAAHARRRLGDVHHFGAAWLRSLDGLSGDHSLVGRVLSISVFFWYTF